MDGLGYIEEAAERLEEINDAASRASGPMPRGHMDVSVVGVTLRMMMDSGDRSKVVRIIAFQTLRQALINPIDRQIDLALAELSRRNG